MNKTVDLCDALLTRPLNSLDSSFPRRRESSVKTGLPPTRERRYLRAGLIIGFCLLLVNGINAAHAAIPTAGALYVHTDAQGAWTRPIPYEVGQDAKNADIPLAYAGDTLTRSSVMTFSNGAAAHGYAEARFGVLKAYGDAAFPNDYGYGYIDGKGDASFVDFIPLLGPVGSIYNYTATFKVSGTHSIPDFEIGGHFSANAVARVRISNDTQTFDWYPNWSSSDAESTHTFTNSFSITKAHEDAYLIVSGFLLAESYVSGSSKYRYAETNYHHTGVFELASSNGGNTTGVSGANYAPVPLPAAWGLFAVGLGVLLRKRGA